MCLEILHRLHQRIFELANAVQFTTGQAFVMAFQAGGAHALDRALESLAYAHAEMTRTPASALWLKPAGKMRIIARQVVDRSHLPGYVPDELLAATEQLAEKCVDPTTDLVWKQPKVRELEAIGVTGDPTDVLWKKAKPGSPNAASMPRARPSTRCMTGSRSR